MLLKVYTVYDSCSEAYLTPMFFATRGQAIRALTEAANNCDHNFYKYADQYTLFEIGVFDDSNASFELYSSPKSLGVCTEFKSIVQVSQLQKDAEVDPRN